jgi:hypothetical protein
VEAGSGQTLLTRIVVDPVTGHFFQLVVASRPQRLQPERVAAFFESFRLGVK